MCYLVHVITPLTTTEGKLHVGDVPCCELLHVLLLHTLLGSQALVLVLVALQRQHQPRSKK